jgi:hypothetical protein
MTFTSALIKWRVDHEHTGNLVASTYESKETLLTRYKEDRMNDRIDNLEGFGAEVINGLDCTWLKEAFPVRRFDMVIFNFPHAGKPEKLKSLKGGDGHPWLQWRHKNLMLFFFRAARSVLNENGRVIVSTNRNAYCASQEDLAWASRASGFTKVAQHQFREWKHSKYDRAYGDWRDEDQLKGELNKDGGYRGQMKTNEQVFCFQLIDVDVGELFYVEPPTAKEVAPQVASCKCGLLVPRDKHIIDRHRREKGCFLQEAGKDHSEMTRSSEHEDIVYDTLIEDVMNGQEALRRLNTGDETVIESDATRKDRERQNAPAAAGDDAADQDVGAEPGGAMEMD